MRKKITIRNFLAAALFLMANIVFAAVPEDGWWWNPTEAGRGFNIETQNGTVFVATFIYDGAGQPVWFSGSGQLSSNGQLNATLMRSEGGQCVGCPFQAPSTTLQADITIQFHSASNATVNWQGTTIEIERFNFALGDVNEKLRGEWLFTIGSPSFPIYFGERITLLQVSNFEGGPRAAGHITGRQESPALFGFEESLQGSGFSYLGLWDSSTNTFQWVIFNFVGENRIEGRSTIESKEEGAEAAFDTLIVREGGLSFVALRNQANAAFASELSVKSEDTAMPEADFAREEISAFLSSLKERTGAAGEKTVSGKGVLDIQPFIEFMGQFQALFE